MFFRQNRENLTMRKYNIIWYAADSLEVLCPRHLTCYSMRLQYVILGWPVLQILGLSWEQLVPYLLIFVCQTQDCTIGAGPVTNKWYQSNGFCQLNCYLVVWCYEFVPLTTGSWRRDLSLQSHHKDWRSGGSNQRPLDCKASILTWLCHGCS